ncbi:acyltransferase [Coraliomargarita algicola]|uniref:Acyltransferase n=1 Tax=Coraliomargarita algicola TaxID=3092156 RepID=A0ABZ0RQD8_9BACT|nr:acyltransferase [Coraliomargarita sp. J2-16]WPJ97722.1 acyltransferase [Coraliomargarita sp. J2-16]
MNFKALLKRVYLYSLPDNTVSRGVFSLIRKMIDVLALGWDWLSKTFWVEPLFRSQHQAGKELWIERSPYIAGQGKIRLGERVRLSGKVGFSFMPLNDGTLAEIIVGEDSFIGSQCFFCAAERIEIGRHCLIAAETTIRDNDGHPLDALRRRENARLNADEVRAVTIGDDVWIGNRAMILKGVTIGDRAIVASCAVVTKDVAADTIVAGNPARVVRELPQVEEPLR